jgi:hypothetical protein
MQFANHLLEQNVLREKKYKYYTQHTFCKTCSLGDNETKGSEGGRTITSCVHFVTYSTDGWEGNIYYDKSIHPFLLLPLGA